MIFGLNLQTPSTTSATYSQEITSKMLGRTCDRPVEYEGNGVYQLDADIFCISCLEARGDDMRLGHLVHPNSGWNT